MKVIIFLVLFITALFSNTSSLEKVSLAFEWKYQFQFAGYIAAKEKGFYKDAGFDVELLEYDGRDTINMITNNETTFATAKSKVILEKMRGKELVLLASFFKKSALVFIAQEGIKYPQEFFNHSIMSTQNELIYSNLGILLKKFGITSNDFIYQEETFNVDDFMNKKVDIMSAFISNELYHLDKANYKYNIINPINYGIYTYNENLITSLEYATKNPARTRAFKEASIKGWEYALEHKREIIDIIYNRYSKLKSKKALLYEAYKTAELIMPHIFDIGYIDKLMLQNIAQTYVEVGLSSKYYNLDNFIFDEKKNPIEDRDRNFNISIEEQEYLKSKKIRMCVDPAWMPYEAIIDGKYTGIGADYFKEIEKILQKDIEIVHTSTWSESIQKGKDRECDIFSMIVETPQRKKFLNFTDITFSFPIVISTLKETPFLDNINIHSDKKFSIIKDYAIKDILKQQNKNLQLVPIDNINEAMKLIQNKEVYGHIDYLASSAYFIRNNYYATIKVNTKLDDSLNIKIGVRNDDKILLSIFNKASNLVSSKDKELIINSWLSVEYTKNFDYSLLYKVIFVFSIILLFMLFRYVIVSKNNKKLQILQDELSELNTSLQVKMNKEIVKNLRKDKYIQEQNKLAAMGEMVGAIAHQWRQPLNSLNINIQNLDDDYDDGLINREFIDTFIDKQSATIKFMSKTIDDFRNFFRVDKIKEEFSIKEAIQSTINIQSAQLATHNINIEIIGNDFIFNGLKSEFQQVILNLITNAKDELVDRDIHSPTIKIIITDNLIRVLDNAGGIPQNIISRIFEPYFTTKEQGKGTGMGLYMSKMIIETNMNGKFSVKNIDNGAEFAIKLN